MGVRRSISHFFNNWYETDDSLVTKVRKATRNRMTAGLTKGCCGHPGEPGC